MSPKENKPKGVTITLPPGLVAKLVPWVLAALAGGGGVAGYSDQTARLDRVERMQEQILDTLISIANEEPREGPDETP